MPSNDPFIPEFIGDYVERNNRTRRTAPEAALDEATERLQEPIKGGIKPGQPISVMETRSELANLLALQTGLLGAQHDLPMNALDLGTFTGHSALVIAQAMPKGGEVISCDVDTPDGKKYTAIAEKYWKDAGVADRIELKLCGTEEHNGTKAYLQTLLDEGKAATFDLVFIDANKDGYGDYYEKALELLRPGGLIILDNMLWSGRVADPMHRDRDTAALRSLNEKISQDKRVRHVLLSADDGIMMVWKLDPKRFAGLAQESTRGEARQRQFTW